MKTLTLSRAANGYIITGYQDGGMGRQVQYIAESEEKAMDLIKTHLSKPEQPRTRPNRRAAGLAD